MFEFSFTFSLHDKDTKTHVQQRFADKARIKHTVRWLFARSKKYFHIFQIKVLYVQVFIVLWNGLCTECFRTTACICTTWNKKYISGTKFCNRSNCSVTHRVKTINIVPSSIFSFMRINKFFLRFPIFGLCCAFFGSEHSTQGGVRRAENTQSNWHSWWLKLLS